MRASRKNRLKGDGDCGLINEAGRRQCWVAAQAFFTLLLTFAVASQVTAAPMYPLAKSTNGRYLVDQNNVPYLITGDSPQALIVNLSEADAEVFLANRATNGFNTMWINLLCNDYTGGRADGSTFDGILPFSNVLSNYTPARYDLTTPNEAYFARVDRVLSNAAQLGLLVVFDPIETGGWLNTILDNGAANCRAYGQYLGNRYKNFDNIIWLNGNDYTDWSDSGVDPVVQQVALGIQNNDSRHIQTIELGYPVSGSLDDANWASIIQLNATYTYYPTYAQVLTDYNRANFLPTFMVEANYEFEHDWIGNSTLRRQEYWSLLSGACGQLYGNHYTWQFLSGWQTNLDTSGSTQVGYVKALFGSQRWYDLVPDQHHTLVTAGYGTFTSTGSVNDSDYATAAQTADGTLGMVYLPTLQTITVDLSQLSGPVTAQWYDPSSGVYAAIPGSPFANSGTQDFTPTGNNADGDGDWMLVLGGTPDTTASTWEVTVSGVPRATCVLNFAADSTVSGYGIEQSLCGAFTMTGTWSQDLKGLLSGTFDQTFSNTNCQHGTTVDGTFAARPGKSTTVSATARDIMGALRWNAVRNPSFPVLAADWGGTLKIKKTKMAEIYELTPEGSRPGLYSIQGQSADATYTLTGALIVTSRNLVTAYIVRQLPTGPVASFYTGRLNFVKQTLTLRGKDATGAKHQLSVVAQ